MDSSISGVYEIRNKINGHRYIGSSVDIEKRWNLHNYQLDRNKHHSIYLQRAWNKYGRDSFSFLFLEKEGDKKGRLELEQKYIDTLCPEYNIAPKAGSRLGDRSTEKTKEKLRKWASQWTDEEREMRRLNMLENAIPAAAKWHKTKAGRQWHKNHYQKFGDKLHEKKELTCEQCGNKYESESGRFCSNSCKSAWRRKSGLDNIVKKCCICGSEFELNKYAKTETCSRSCGSKLIWINHRNKGQ